MMDSRLHLWYRAGTSSMHRQSNWPTYLGLLSERHKLVVGRNGSGFSCCSHPRGVLYTCAISVQTVAKGIWAIEGEALLLLALYTW